MPRVSLRKLCWRVFGTITIMSLVLCLTTVGLWVRSYWTLDVCIYRPDLRNASRDNFVEGFQFGSTYGTLTFWRREFYGLRNQRLAHYARVSTPMDVATDALWFKFSSVDRKHYASFPHWSLALLFAIVPTWWGMAIVRARRRSQPGCCVACGYDLRVQLALSQTLSEVEGSEQSESNGRAPPGRCPECGTKAVQNDECRITLTQIS